VEQSFEGGALFVDLTPTSDEATVLAAVVGALNPTSQAPNGSREALLGLLAVSSPVLLVFDNCEHVLGPASELLVDALGTNESLRVLATSRESLTIPGEHAFAVAPLDAPGRMTQHPLTRSARSAGAWMGCRLPSSLLPRRSSRSHRNRSMRG